MAKADRIDNAALLGTGLEIMRQHGKPLTKLPTRGRARLYTLSNGETVRVRTSNDHILVAVAEEPREGARLNVEGTDWLLIVMPVTERTHGPVMVFLVPTEAATREIRRAHKEWLSTRPATGGSNTTWNLWFDKAGPVNANDFASKWAEYRLEGNISTREVSLANQAPAGGPENIKAAVLAAKETIAAAAGVSPRAIKISIDFGI